MMIKVFSLACALVFATSALAQSAFIGSPAAGASVAPGSQLVVEVDRPNSLTASEEVAVVIGIASCGSGPCPSPYGTIGNVLYNGPYDPQYSTPPYGLPPHQNFTVTIPSDLNAGPALLSVTHLTLVGLAYYPLFEIKNVTVNVS